MLTMKHLTLPIEEVSASEMRHTLTCLTAQEQLADRNSRVYYRAEPDILSRCRRCFGGVTIFMETGGKEVVGAWAVKEEPFVF